MEYIREVLERQEAALRRLLLGRREGETGAERTEETARRAGREDTGREAAGRIPAAQETLRQALERRSAERRAEMAGGPGLAGPGTAPVPPAGQETGERPPIRRETGPAAETAARGAGWAAIRRGAGAEAGRGGRRDDKAPVRREAGMEAAAAAGEAVSVREFREGSPSGGGEAKALSRAFQRDARRYDGAFRLY